VAGRQLGEVGDKGGDFNPTYGEKSSLKFVLNWRMVTFGKDYWVSDSVDINMIRYRNTGAARYLRGGIVRGGKGAQIARSDHVLRGGVK